MQFLFGIIIFKLHCPLIIYFILHISHVLSMWTKYCFNQWLQKCRGNNCTYLHLFLLRESFVLFSPWWLLLLKFLQIKKWLGVGDSKSFALSLFAVNGLLLTIFSTSVNSHHLKVAEDPVLDYMEQGYFHNPKQSFPCTPMCGKLGGLNFHLALCWSVKFVILSWFNFGCSKLKFWVALLKLDPQSGTSV